MLHAPCARNRITKISATEITFARQKEDWGPILIYHTVVPAGTKKEKGNPLIARFPENFMFQHTKEEFEILIFQIGTTSWGGRRKLLYAPCSMRP